MVCVLAQLSLVQDTALFFMGVSSEWVGSHLFFPNFLKFGWRFAYSIHLVGLDTLYPEKRHNSPTGLLYSVAYQSTQSPGLF